MYYLSEKNNLIFDEVEKSINMRWILLFHHENATRFGRLERYPG